MTKLIELKFDIFTTCTYLVLIKKKFITNGYGNIIYSQRRNQGFLQVSETPMDFFDVILIFEKKTSIFYKCILNALSPSKCVSKLRFQKSCAPDIFGTSFVFVFVRSR